MNMKKLLLLFALCIIPMAANAQLNVKRQVEKMEKITSVRTGFCKLMHQGDDFYISVVTSNRYDDNFILELGEGKESALSTLEDLISLCTTIEKGAPVVISNGGKECTIYKGLTGNLDFSQSGYAGMASIAKYEFNTFWKALKAYELKSE